MKHYDALDCTVVSQHSLLILIYAADLELLAADTFDRGQHYVIVIMNCSLTLYSTGGSTM